MSLATSQPGFFRSLVWKETWQLKEFFVAMLALSALLQFLVTAAIKAVGPASTSHAGFLVYSVVGGFVALFAAACGATLYATEKEERTYQNLQLLPLTSSQLMQGKVTAAAGLCGLFFLLSILIAYLSIQFWGGQAIGATTDGSVSDRWLTTYLIVFGLASVEFFVWSWLLSVVLSKPLNAAMLGIFCASAAIQLGVFLSLQKNIDYASPIPYLVAWPWRLINVAIVTAVATWLSRNWLGTTPRAQALSDSSNGRSATGMLSRVRTRMGRNGGAFGRLVWQSSRESWMQVATAFLASSILAAILVMLSPPLAAVAIPIVIAAGGLAGLAAFSADQKRSSMQFLAAHGVSATRIWLARVLPWAFLIPIVISAIFLVTIWVMATINQVQLTPQLFFLGMGNPLEEALAREVLAMSGFFAIGLVVGVAIAGVLLCFSAGQFISLLIRSRILAVVVTLVVCVPLIAWVSLMALGHVPFWWSVAPIAVACCVAGRIVLGARLTDRMGFKAAATATTLVVATCIAVLLGVSYHRANEIPAAIVQFDRHDASNPELVREIETRIRGAAASISYPPEFPDGLETLFPIALKTDREFTPPTTPPTEKELEIARLHGPWNLPGSKDALMYANVSELYSTPSAWTDRWRSGQVIDVDELIDLPRQLIEQNRESLQPIREAIQFAWDNQDQLLQRQPQIFSQGQEILFPRYSSTRELLILDFLNEIDKQNPQAAWSSLKALAQYHKLQQIEVPEARHWYQAVLPHFSTWTLCDGMTPELLDEGLRFAIRELRPLDRQRTLEYQYLSRQRRLSKDGLHQWVNSEHRTQSESLQWLLWLPCERERANRILDNWCAVELEALNRKPRDRKYDLPADSVARWFFGFGNNAVTLLRPRKMPDWEKEIRQRVQSRWFATTITPWNYYRSDSFFQGMRGSQWNRLYGKDRLDEIYQERTELLFLQMFAVGQKLKTGEFPSDLGSAWFLVTHFDADPRDEYDTLVQKYHYFPKGVSSSVAILEQDRSTTKVLDSNIPFLCNRNPVARLARDNADWSSSEMVAHWILPPESGWRYPVGEPPPMWVKLSNDPLEQ